MTTPLNACRTGIFRLAIQPAPIIIWSSKRMKQQPSGRYLNCILKDIHFQQSRKSSKAKGSERKKAVCFEKCPFLGFLKMKHISEYIASAIFASRAVCRQSLIRIFLTCARSSEKRQPGTPEHATRHTCFPVRRSVASAAQKCMAQAQTAASAGLTTMYATKRKPAAFARIQDLSIRKLLKVLSLTLLSTESCKAKGLIS